MSEEEGERSRETRSADQEEVRSDHERGTKEADEGEILREKNEALSLRCSGVHDAGMSVVRHQAQRLSGSGQRCASARAGRSRLLFASCAIHNMPASRHACLRNMPAFLSLVHE